MENDSQYPNQNKGIIIKEPAEDNKLLTLVHVPDKENGIDTSGRVGHTKTFDPRKNKRNKSIPYDDEDSSDDPYYVEQEESSDASGKYASLESEETTSDEHAENLTESFSPHALVDVVVSSTFDNALESGHPSPKGRG
ncbi:hypothetical protein CQW23_12160 [Capsicum baccatum]|uniref:Uncharacterized protein n=1 Tax=Capsicum baccatum TaxID=33114 RepID=A0A2G2WRX2_CAPBA|nr:hypothetical protein CQW23_12160 [Capsicum baccatum]